MHTLNTRIVVRYETAKSRIIVRYETTKSRIVVRYVLNMQVGSEFISEREVE